MRTQCVCIILMFVLLSPAVLFAGNKPEWETAYDTGYSDRSTGIAIDSADNVYVTAYAQNTAVNESTALLLKYDPSGQLIWERDFILAPYTYFTDIAIDDFDDIYVTGNAGSDSFLVKYNAGGDLLWSATLERAYNYTKAPAIDIDDTGALHVLLGDTRTYYVYCYPAYFPGSTTSWYHVGYTPEGGPLSRSYLNASIATCQNSSGNAWSDLAVTPAGDELYLGGAQLYRSGRSGVISKFTSDGTMLWENTAVMPGYSQGISSLAHDQAGEIYAGGSYYEGGMNAYNGKIFKYDSSGNLLWQQTYGEGNDTDEYINRIALDVEGNVVTAGYQRPDDYELLSLKYAPDGDLLKELTYAIADVDRIEAAGIVAGSDNALYLTGHFSESTKHNSPFDSITLKYSQ